MRNPIKQQFKEMTLNPSGVRDIARVLHVSPTSSMIQELKKLCPSNQSNRNSGNGLPPEQVEGDVVRVEEAAEFGVAESELAEMWNYVGSKKNPHWLGTTIDRSTGQVLADVFSRHQDEVFFQLKKLLLELGIKHYCTNGWGAVRRDIY